MAANDFIELMDLIVPFRTNEVSVDDFPFDAGLLCRNILVSWFLTAVSEKLDT